MSTISGSPTLLHVDDVEAAVLFLKDVSHQVSFRGGSKQGRNKDGFATLSTFPSTPRTQQQEHLFAPLLGST